MIGGRHVITISNKNRGYYRAFDKTCREVGGYEPTILGMGKTWMGYEAKIQWALDWLVDKNIHPDDLILVTDRYDVLFTGPVDRAFDQFLEEEAKSTYPAIIMSHDVVSAWLRWSFGTIGEDKQSINVGAFVLRAKTLKTMYASIMKSHEEGDRIKCDQSAITSYLHKNLATTNLIIDRNDLFLLYCEGNVKLGSKIRWKKGEGKYNEIYLRQGSTCTRPILIHRPGNADMSLLIRDLGLSKEYEETDRNKFEYLWCNFKGEIHKKYLAAILGSRTQ